MLLAIDYRVASLCSPRGQDPYPTPLCILTLPFLLSVQRQRLVKNAINIFGSKAHKWIVLQVHFWARTNWLAVSSSPRDKVAMGAIWVLNRGWKSCLHTPYTFRVINQGKAKPWQIRMFLFSLILFNKPSLFLLSHSTVYTQNCTIICNKVAVEKGALIQASLAGREGKCGSVKTEGSVLRGCRPRRSPRGDTSTRSDLHPHQTRPFGFPGYWREK